jgi:beta-mannosidase
MDFLSKQPFVDLSGQWEFAYGDAPAGEIASIAAAQKAGLAMRPATVPGNLELDLQAGGLIDEPFYGLNILGLQKLETCHCWYTRRFEASRREGFVAELTLEGVDCYADIYLNGRLVGSCDNMLVEHRFAVDEFLQGSNELFIHIRPSMLEATKYEYPAGVGAMARNNESLYVRKAPHMYGWDIMPRALSAGLWRPVKLRYRPAERIEDVFLQTGKLMNDRRDARLRMHCKTTIADAAAARYELLIEGSVPRMPKECSGGAFSVRKPVVFAAGQYWFDIENAKLWWPRGLGEANLYEVTVTLLRNGVAIDQVSFTHGIRMVELIRTSVTTPDGQGEFCLKINGERVFCKGSNWVPADAYHSRDAARIPRILELAEQLECNILRCWGGNVYEDNIFFDMCDRSGIMVWQDFAMACAIYPQDREFAARLEAEATQVVKRLRQHACVVIWAGDNECDCAYAWNHKGDPNDNVLTRRVLPEVLKNHDGTRPFLPSSPYIDSTAWKAGEELLPEKHLWGPRDYYKGDYYRNDNCHFVSEIGYHACVAEESIRTFIEPKFVWPCDNNPQWNLHSTNPTLGTDLINPADARVKLMTNQVRCLFGAVPPELSSFIFASQATQGEALKYFIERFRAGKWRRTGMIWWNLMDGWPQFSDAIVDYYFNRKLAWHFVKLSQQHVAMMVREDQDGRPRLSAVNDTLVEVPLQYKVHDVQSGLELAGGTIQAKANSACDVCDLAGDKQGMYVIQWETPTGQGKNHYLAGKPPYALEQYRGWLAKSGLYPVARASCP